MTDPNDLDAILERVDALNAKGEHDAAEATVMQALQSRPNEPRLHEALARSVMHRDRSLAVRASQYAVSIAPNDPLTHLNYARVLAPADEPLQLFQLEMARTAVEHAVALAPNDPEVLREQARLHMLYGRRGDAIRTAQRAASDDPSREVDDRVTRDLTSMLVASMSWMIILGAGFAALNEESWGAQLGSRPLAARIACGVVLLMVALRLAIAWGTYERITGRPRSWVRESFREEEPLGFGLAQFVATMTVLLVIGAATGLPFVAGAVAITCLLGQITFNVLRAKRAAAEL